jgi:hypothetical protein
MRRHRNASQGQTEATHECDGDRDRASFPRRREHEFSVVAWKRGGAVHERDLVGAARSRHRSQTLHADHRFARHERGELVFGKGLGISGTLRQHEVAHVRARVPTP